MCSRQSAGTGISPRCSRTWRLAGRPSSSRSTALSRGRPGGSGSTSRSRPPSIGSSRRGRRATRDEDCGRGLWCGRVAVRGEPVLARRRRGLGVRPERAAHGGDQPRRPPALRRGRRRGSSTGDERRLRAPGLRVRDRGDEGDAHGGRDCRDGACLRGRRLRRDRPERPRQRGDDRGARRARDPWHDLPGRQAARAGSRAVGRAGRHDVRPVRRAGAAGRGRATRRRLHARRDAGGRGRGRARAAVAQGHLQCVDQPDRRPHRPHPRPRVRAARPARARHRARGRGEGGRGGAGDRARRRSRGADRPRSEAGGRVRPQGVHASGRRGWTADGGRLPQRRHRLLRARGRRADAAQRRDPGARERSRGFVDAELTSRHARVREALERDGLDAALVCGSEYTGFEGAVTYLSGFQIVHRYAYVLVPREGEPAIVFPAEARYVGEHGDSQIADQVFAERPGEWLADHLRGQRVGVYGLDYVLTVRDYSALAGAAELVPWDTQFDLARAVKSEAELVSVRESVEINVAGFHAFREVWAPGRNAAEVLAPAEGLFVERGCGRLTMNMVLVGAEFAIAHDDTVFGELTIPSLEIAGPGGHWVEVSRALGTPSDEVQRMLEAYEEYYEVAQTALRPGATAHDVHRAVSTGFTQRGYHLGHVTGHSIGMTMIEHPKIGEGIETELAANMVFSMHPHAIAADGRECLYMQDTWLVTEDGGVPLAGLEMRIW